MSANILVATPHPAMGELLRLSLEESSKYRVRLAQNGREALAAAGRITFDIAILDAAIPDQTIASLMRSLLEPNPGLKLVIIPPENDPSRLSLNGLRPNATLNLPFYAPDLLELVNNLLNGAYGADEGKTTPDQPSCVTTFQKDPTQIKELLGSLLEQISAQAGLVICSRELIASAGRFEPERVQEVADLVNRSWNEQNPGDLARYVRLSEGGGEFMVYATSLASGTVLALIYDTAAHMTRIHRQALKTAQALRALPDAGTAAQPIIQPETAQIPPGLSTPQLELQAAPEAPAPEPSAALPEEAGNEMSDLFSSPAPTGQVAADLLLALKNHKEQQVEGAVPAAQAAQPVTEAIQAAPEAEKEEEEIEETASEEGDLPEISLSDLLAAMPPPDPGEHKLQPGIEWITGDEEDGSAGDFLFPWEKAAQVEGTDGNPQPALEIAPAAIETAPQLSAQVSGAETAQPETAGEAPEPATGVMTSTAEVVHRVIHALKGVEIQPAEEASPVASSAEPSPILPPATLESVPEPAPSAPVTLATLPEPPPSDGATEKIIHPVAQDPAAAVGATRPVINSYAAPTQRIAAPFAGVPLPPAPSPEPWNRPDELDAPGGDFASLTYTCVMLPRLPDIKLSGRLVNKLAEQLQHICLAYGWRLVNQVIRPDTFQWTVQVSAIVSPGSVARLVRQQTSQFIFDQFEQFSSLLPSGDFWAPGYLIISGAQAPETRLIGEYIRQTRKRQGIRL
jgi:DNA-binding response OmpR family regulator/REP element-mobilizing transposase RayT